MGSFQQVMLALGSAVDPFYSSVVLLCPFSGTDGSTTITDLKGHTMTAQGDAQLDTTQFQWPPSSLLLDGTGDSVKTPDSNDWNFGSGDFTIEAWIRFNSTSGDQTVVSQWETPTNRAWALRKLSTGELDFRYSKDGGSTTFAATGTWSPSTATWYYVAAKRATTTVSIWADGTQLATLAAGTDVIKDSLGSLRIGSLFVSPAEQQFVNGWIGALRITKGVARDVSVIPTTPFPTS
jgi:hypothetical protein